MPSSVAAYAVEDSAVGRIVVPPHVPQGIVLFYTTRDFEGRGDAIARLADVVRERGIDARLATCNQVHGATVTRAPESEATWRECDSCDALWSAQTASAIGIKVADCLPVTMVDSSHRVIANVHSGWRGAAQRITSATLDALERETPFDRNDAHVWLGPSIRVCCFEVGEEVVDEFRASYDHADTFVDRTRGAKPHIDLPALTADVLRARGVAAERIHDSGLCTMCESELFHSYRKHGKAAGRNFAVVAQ